jgi:hypothetical protein
MQVGCLVGLEAHQLPRLFAPVCYWTNYNPAVLKKPNVRNARQQTHTEMGNDSDITGSHGVECKYDSLLVYGTV